MQDTQHHGLKNDLELPPTFTFDWNLIQSKLILMKTTAAILIATTALAHADLIDLTPNGFNIGEPWPEPVVQFFHAYQHGQQNLAGANLNGNQVTWSPFTLFGPDNFSISAQQPNANVAWSLTNTAGYHVDYVFVEGFNGIDHLYGVIGGITGAGLVTINGLEQIGAITFAGSNLVPDAGSTLLMLSLAGLVLFYVRKNDRRGTN